MTSLNTRLLLHKFPLRISLSSSFPFVRGEVLPTTFSPPHLIVVSTLLCHLSSSSSLPPPCQPDRSQMTEFFQPTTHVHADWDWLSYVYRTCRTQSNRHRTFNQTLVHKVTNNRASAYSEMLLHDSRIRVKETSQKDKLVSELGVSPRNK